MPPVVVYSPATSGVREVVGEAAVFALQDEPRGTGDAVRAALAGRSPTTSAEVLVLSGDVPLVRAERPRRRCSSSAGSTTRRSPSSRSRRSNPADLGRVVRNEFGSVERIVEADGRLRRGARDERDQCRPVRLRRRLAAGPDRTPTPSPSNGELYLTELVQLAREDGRIVSGARRSRTTARSTASTTAASSPRPSGPCASGSTTAHMRAGVTMRDPSTAYVDGTRPSSAEDVTSSRTSSCAAPTSDRARGPSSARAARSLTSIDRRRLRRLGAASSSAPTVEDRRDRRAVRPPPAGQPHRAPAPRSATTRRSRTPASGARVKQHHMSYLGDAEVGSGTNIGAGTITANWDGRASTARRSASGVFLGVDTMLVAPISSARARRPEPGPWSRRTCRRASSRSASRPGSASPREQPAKAGTPDDPMSLPIGELLIHRLPDVPRGLLRRGRDRARLGPPQPHRAARRRGQRRGARRVRRLIDDPGRFLAVIPARADVHRLLRLGVSPP